MSCSQKIVMSFVIGTYINQSNSNYVKWIQSCHSILLEFKTKNWWNKKPSSGNSTFSYGNPTTNGDSVCGDIHTWQVYKSARTDFVAHQFTSLFSWLYCMTNLIQICMRLLLALAFFNQRRSNWNKLWRYLGLVPNSLHQTGKSSTFSPGKSYRIKTVT